MVGANFRFGARAAGDVATLREAGRDRDFEVEGIALDGGPQVWSSTYVRTCLAAGDVEGAAEALGRPYSVVGQVVEGEHRGRELGYPTANVPTRGLAAPADGVYAGWLTRLDRAGGSGRPLPAAISVGTNPTFDGERDRRVEAYVLDRTDLELYGEPVEISFVARIRGMVKFEGVDALVETMAEDVVRTRELLGLTGEAGPADRPAGRDRRVVPAQRSVLLRARAARRAPSRRCSPRRTLPLLVLVTALVAAAAGVGLAWFSEEFSLAPAALVTIAMLAALWYALTALQGAADRHVGAVADLRRRCARCCR